MNGAPCLSDTIRLVGCCLSAACEIAFMVMCVVHRIKRGKQKRPGN